MTSIRKIYYPEQKTDDWLEVLTHKIRMKTHKTVGKGRILDEIRKTFKKQIDKHLKTVEW